MENGTERSTPSRSRSHRTPRVSRPIRTRPRRGSHGSPDRPEGQLSPRENGAGTAGSAEASPVVGRRQLPGNSSSSSLYRQQTIGGDDVERVRRFEVHSREAQTLRTKHHKQKYQLEDMELKNTLGTGTFGRVVLVRHRSSREYFALKILPIVEVIRLKQVDHVKSEKAILLMVKHPFIVNLLWADHNDRFLYMLLEYVCGGELFTYLRNAGRFTTGAALFYAAEIVSALDYLHALCLVYRDLKPENLLLDRQGHLKLTDFGFAKKLDDRTWTLCGTPEYLAPEIIQSKGHNKAVDWWALGILVYEMLVGYPPFFDDKPFGIYEKILAGKIDWPKHVDPIARDLIKKLLVQDRTKRLGNMKNGADDVKNHRWFRNVNWDDVYDRKTEPPIVPRIRHTGDTRNFFEYPEHDDWQSWYENQPNNEVPIVPRVDHDGDSRNFEAYPEVDLDSIPPSDVLTVNGSDQQDIIENDASLFEDF